MTPDRRQNGRMLLLAHPLLWTAIENTRMIRFAYHGKDRIAEP